MILGVTHFDHVTESGWRSWDFWISLSFPVPIPVKEKKLSLIFIFTFLCGDSKDFFEGLKIK